MYPQYQVYLSASIWETFGLTLLEAASYGLSLIGLNVHYGNQLFIEDGKNGYLVDYDHNADEEVVIHAMAEKIITYYSLTFEEEAAFHQHSRQLSHRFTEEKLLAEWQEFLKNS
ncbi:poly(glycerol-phosphate) alpha-glucosyltransferase [Streptococcus penaeicida]|uniref:Poly(Glycerol-phosphate) alpha-glucosyltransferase n=1 Tax=Streptococcus penaeicida TaxID=1765960 RepID=A0A2N8LDH9_9STRE|nr:poly(glycerol-phosphate) alpha-glucosyltransferase [Streptococcus penaeicida]